MIKSIDTFNIKGRGIVKIVSAEESDGLSVGDELVIDDTKYKIKGIERMGVNTSRPVGLLVEVVLDK